MITKAEVLKINGTKWVQRRAEAIVSSIKTEAAAADVLALAKQVEISEGSVRRARTKLKFRTKKKTVEGGWFYSRY